MQLCNCKLGAGKQYNTVHTLKYPKFLWPTFFFILKEQWKKVVSYGDDYYFNLWFMP